MAEAAVAAAVAAGAPTAAKVHPAMLQAARGVLSHSSGMDCLDDAIARGYLLVNTGAYAAAVSLFDVLLADFPDLVAAHVAKGSACALCGEFGMAVDCFTAAVKSDPSCFDAWKRRAQTQAARGDQYLAAALADINQAEKLDKAAVAASPSSSSSSAFGLSDPDIWHQRGTVLHRLKDFKAGAKDFERFVAVEADHAIGWNYVGLCRSQLGDLR